MAECQTVTGSEQRYFEKECNSPKFSSIPAVDSEVVGYAVS